jgi:hypothetical protein
LQSNLVACEELNHNMRYIHTDAASVKLVKSSPISVDVAVIITLAARAFLVFQSRTGVVEVAVCGVDKPGY